MSFISESKQDVLNYINVANSTSYVLNDVTFGTPAPTEGSWQGNVTTKNTVVRVSAKEGGTYQGSVRVVYDRLDLSILPKIQGFKPRASSPATTLDILAGIRYFTGLSLTADDIVSSPMTDNGNGTYTGTLTAKSSSLGWIGSAQVTVQKGGDRLSDIITDTSLDGLNYPTSSDQEVYGALYMYPYDMTPYFDTLIDFDDDVVLTTEQIDALVLAFNTVDVSSGKGLWNGTGQSTTWSLGGAKCVRNGLNGSDLPTNPNYKYVAAIELRADVTTPRGVLYLHYNDPQDLNSV
jgi:hypothetical protein